MTSTDMIIAAVPHKSQAERARMRANAERWLDKGTPAQKLDARRLIDAMDALRVAEAATLHDLIAGTPVEKRVVASFTKRPPSETDATVILAMLNNPGSTSTALSQACSWKGQSWHAHFGRMCKKREADLWPADLAITRDGNFYCGILADLDPDGNRFTMKPDVAVAFAELGFAARVAGAGGGA